MRCDRLDHEARSAETVTRSGGYPGACSPSTAVDIRTGRDAACLTTCLTNCSTSGPTSCLTTCRTTCLQTAAGRRRRAPLTWWSRGRRWSSRTPTTSLRDPLWRETVRSRVLGRVLGAVLGRVLGRILSRVLGRVGVIAARLGIAVRPAPQAGLLAMSGADYLSLALSCSAVSPRTSACSWSCSPVAAVEVSGLSGPLLRGRARVRGPVEFWDF